MRFSNLRPLRQAFTLVEVLVVLAIISVVISLLLPFTRRALRKAQVLASPIAYVGTDNRLHLTDARGRTGITIAPVAKPTCPFCHSPPSWSPSGQSIAMQYQESGHTYTLIANPLSGQRTMLPSYYGFLAWSDSNNIVTASDRSVIAVRDTDNNAALRAYKPPARPLNLSATPLTAPFPFSGAVDIAGRPSIVLFRRDLTVARVLYQYEPGSATTGMKDERVAVDPLGEFVAWTHAAPSGRAVALKSLRDPEWKPLRLITNSNFRHAYFCDWTEEGNILVNASDDQQNWRLWVVNKGGVRLSYVASEVPPIAGAIASWRKYGHR